MSQKLFLILLIIIGVNSYAIAQARRGLSLLDDRGGLMVPENADDLRIVSLELWLKFHLTNQRLYNYIRESAEFRAYVHVCKRNDLNIDMKPIHALSIRNLSQVILAHYEEPEFTVLEAMTKQQQATLMEDIVGDLYAFEYGYKVAEQDTAITASGDTRQSFCEGIADTHFKKYVALLATAKRQ
jgi:hypothetical protein